MKLSFVNLQSDQFNPHEEHRANPDYNGHPEENRPGMLKQVTAGNEHARRQGQGDGGFAEKLRELGNHEGQHDDGGHDQGDTNHERIAQG